MRALALALLCAVAPAFADPSPAPAASASPESAASASPEAPAPAASASPEVPAPVASASPAPVAAASPAPVASPTAAPLTGPPPEPLTVVPRANGLPVKVYVAVGFVELGNLDENEEEFSATVDVRLRWEDRRQVGNDPPPMGFQEWRAAAADTRVGEVWVPEVRIANMKGEAEHSLKGVRVFNAGRVEMTQRISGTFRAKLDMTHFPFDRQKLPIRIVASRDDLDLVNFGVQQEDRDFSRAAGGLELDGWEVGPVDLDAAQVPGWYGERHAVMEASLEVERVAGRSVAPIFIPLLASLLIPLLSIWLNKAENGDLTIEAFELSNVIIGGLFAVIALNFTVNAEYKALASSDNTVSRLFALNYLTLGVCLVVNVAVARFNVVQRLFGRNVQQISYLVLSWAIPLATVATAVAIIFSAFV